MENLNKENFFDELEKRYPEAFKKFSGFIDRYKTDNNWDDLFNAQADFFMSRSTQGCEAPKFHDLPYEMQIGVFMRFMGEVGDGNAADIIDEFFGNYTVTLIECFKSIEENSSQEVTEAAKSE